MYPLKPCPKCGKEGIVDGVGEVKCDCKNTPPKGWDWEKEDMSGADGLNDR